jgi:hypothetical protein
LRLLESWVKKLLRYRRRPAFQHLGPRGVVPSHQGVEPLLGLGNPLRNGIAQPLQPPRADRDEERGYSFAALPEVVQAGRDQVAAGKASEFHS